MKKTIIITLCIATVAIIASCNRGPKSELEGFKKTQSGLHYRFDVENPSGRQVQKGDLLTGEMVVRLDGDTLFSNRGDEGNLLIVGDSKFGGDLTEGLTMMHEGDKAVFAVDADAMASHLEPSQMPLSYHSGMKMKIYYEVSLTGVKSAEEVAANKTKFTQELAQMAEKESASIATYITDNGITDTPREDGLYVIINKKGNGPKVAVGKTIRVAYTGRLLDGTVFDTSNPDLANEKGLQSHDALEFTVGTAHIIKGWDEGLMNLPEGTKATLIIPSSLAYGSKGAGDAIPPYAPLVFDVNILSVK